MVCYAFERGIKKLKLKINKIFFIPNLNNEQKFMFMLLIWTAINITKKDQLIYNILI